MLSKVAAGGLAAAVAAVAGSYFGPLGTVGAAAAASVVTALSSELFQRSIDRTAGALRPERSTGPGDGPVGGAGPARRRSPVAALVAAVLTFAVGMVAVTGIEKATDAPLSGGEEQTTTLGHLTNLDVGSAVGGLLGGSDRSRGTGDSGTAPNAETAGDSGESGDGGGSEDSAGSDGAGGSGEKASKEGLLGRLLG